MNCQNLIAELTDYFEEALDPALKTEIELHLNRCEDCRLVVDTTRQTIQIFCKSEPLPLSESTRSRLHDALVARLRRGHS